MFFVEITNFLPVTLLYHLTSSLQADNVANIYVILIKFLWKVLKIDRKPPLVSRISDYFLLKRYVFSGILLAWTFAVIPAIFRLLPPPDQILTIFILLYRVFLFSVSNVRWNMYFCLFYSLFCSFCSLFHFIVQTFFRIFLSCMTCFCPIRLVQRFVNNYTNRVGCGFECAGIKTQA